MALDSRISLLLALLLALLCSLLCWLSLLRSLLCYRLDDGGWLGSRSELASAGNYFLESFRWEEANFLARLDHDGLAGEGIASLTSLAIYLLELSKVVDGDIFALVDVARDRVENDLDGMRCLFLASVEVRSQRSNELGLVHLIIPLFTRKVRRSPNVLINLRTKKHYSTLISRCVAYFCFSSSGEFCSFYA